MTYWSTTIQNLKVFFFNLEFVSEDADCLICDNQSEDDFFRQYYSSSIGEPTEHGGRFDMNLTSRELYIVSATDFHPQGDLPRPPL